MFKVLPHFRISLWLKCGVPILCLLLPVLQLFWLKQAIGWVDVLGALGLQLFVVLMPLVLLGRWRWWMWCLAPAVFGLPVYLFVSSLYQSLPGDVLMSAALTTHWRNSLQLVAGYGRLWLWVPVAGLAWCLWAVKMPNTASLSSRHRRALLAGLLTYAALGMLSRQDFSRWVALPAIFDERVAALVYPVNLVLSARRTLAHQQSSAQGVSVGAQPRDGSLTPLLLVFVVGESVRPDHLGPYGYPRDTTPWLTAHRAEWLAYTDVRSTAQWTAVAVPQLVTRAVPGGGRASLVRAFREAGYQTAWISNQEPTSEGRSADVALFSTEDVEFYYRKDHALLPAFESFVRQGRQSQCVVLHMHGSHFPYAARYEPRFRRFTPTLRDTDVEGHPGPAYKQQAINDYDNTLLALDDFLQRLQRLLATESRPALIVFTSDHGENLFDDERQRFMHAHSDASRWDLEVPLMFWGNAAFHALRPAQWQHLAEHRSLRVGHHDLFPTLLDLALIRWTGEAMGQSLASPRFLPKPRLTYALGDKLTGDADAVR